MECSVYAYKFLYTTEDSTERNWFKNERVCSHMIGRGNDRILCWERRGMGGSWKCSTYKLRVHIYDTLLICIIHYILKVRGIE